MYNYKIIVTEHLLHISDEVAWLGIVKNNLMDRKVTL